MCDVVGVFRCYCTRHLVRSFEEDPPWRASDGRDIRSVSRGGRGGVNWLHYQSNVAYLLGRSDIYKLFWNPVVRTVVECTVLRSQPNAALLSCWTVFSNLDPDDVSREIISGFGVYFSSQLWKLQNNMKIQLFRRQSKIWLCCSSVRRPFMLKILRGVTRCWRSVDGGSRLEVSCSAESAVQSSASRGESVQYHALDGGASATPNRASICCLQRWCRGVFFASFAGQTSSWLGVA